MRRVSRGAIPLLAAALGFARPASAQFTDVTDAADTAVVVSADADDAPPQPRVIPPRRIVLEPMKEPSDGEAAARPAVDLLAPPAVAPSGLPGASPTDRSGPARPSAARPVAVVLHPLTVAAPPAHVWPAAFLVAKESEPTEAKQAAHVETSDDLAPPPWENAEAPIFADLRRRVETVHGRRVTGVSAETQPDGVVVLRVRVRGADADPDVGQVSNYRRPPARASGPC